MATEGGVMQHHDTIQAGGLTAGAEYGLSIETRTPDGHGINLGVSDQAADANGHVVFDVAVPLEGALVRTGGPCHVKVWLRHGGTLETAPPVAPRYVLEWDAI